MILYADDHHGIYIPQHFAQSINREYLSGVKDSDLEILETGPDHEEYWDAWVDVLDHAVVTYKGETYSLWQDGDLWLVTETEMQEMESI